MPHSSLNDDSTMKCRATQHPRNENSDDNFTIDDSTRSLATIDSIFSFTIDGVNDQHHATHDQENWMTPLGKAEFPTGVSLRDLGIPGSNKKDLRQGDTAYPFFDDIEIEGALAEDPPQNGDTQPNRERRWSSFI